MATGPMDEGTEARLYHVAYASARGQMVALSQASGYPLSSRFDRLLVELDAIHQGDLPPAAIAAGTSTAEMMSELGMAVERMIQLGGDAVFLRVLYHLARSTQRSR